MNITLNIYTCTWVLYMCMCIAKCICTRMVKVATHASVLVDDNSLNKRATESHGIWLEKVHHFKVLEKRN